jgi:hypothetical protein
MDGKDVIGYAHRSMCGRDSHLVPFDAEVTVDDEADTGTKIFMKKFEAMVGLMHGWVRMYSM